MIDFYMFNTLKESKSFWADLFSLLLFVPLLKYATDHLLSTTFWSHISTRLFCCFRKECRITLSGIVYLFQTCREINFCQSLLAVCDYVTHNNLTNNICRFDDENPFVVDDQRDIQVENDIWITFTRHIDIDNKDEKRNSADNKREVYEVIIKSKKRTVKQLQEWVNTITTLYELKCAEANKNKIYHFLLSGFTEDTTLPKFTKSILSDCTHDDTKCFETFDTLFSEQKNNIIASVKRLKDIQYYKKNGLKRKLGFLFYGPPGCGKTSHVTALATYDKRHIIEVPMSRVQTNQQLESLLNLKQIQSVKFSKSEIIFLFDEIDQTNTKVLQTQKEPLDEKNKINLRDFLSAALSKDENNIISSSEKDTLNLGCLLSRFDGVGNYDGIIFIATTNFKERLSPALYRHGRLTPIFFSYSTKQNMIDMIEYYFEAKMLDEEKELVPTEDDKIAPCHFRKILEDFQNNYQGFLKMLKNKEYQFTAIS
jgi:hypothetical protein